VVIEAQEAKARETFEVASIREHQGSSARPGFRQQPSGLNATNATALDLIEFAFDVIERDVVGELPSWVKTTRFDVAARTANGPLTPRRVRAMARALLKDRFRLEASSERVDGRVYALVPAGVTGRLIRTSESTCEVDAPLRDAAEQRVPVRVLDLSARCGFSILTSGDTLSGLFGTRVTMQEFAAQLSRVGGFDLPVVDRTGLDGEFDVAVAPQPDMVAPTNEARFLIALREQAGLILRTEQGSFDVLRIRRIEQPSPN
jgi:uncharacterized protein (TIGR03435 family)